VPKGFPEAIRRTGGPGNDYSSIARDEVIMSIAGHVEADLCGTHLTGTNLTGAVLHLANLTRTVLIGTNLQEANLDGCSIYGICTWDIKTTASIQSNLVITPEDEPVITVDSIEVAQFICLLLANEKIRKVIDSITSKAVLILGRFSPERKVTLDAVRNELRRHNYVPILFDFERPSNRDFTETVSTLAHLSRFVIADLTDPRSIPQELTAIVPRLLSVPVQPLLRGTHQEWGMARDLFRYPQVLPPLYYSNDAKLISSLQDGIIEPAERRAREIAITYG
jgi:hypothetical protein